MQAYFCCKFCGTKFIKYINLSQSLPHYIILLQKFSTGKVFIITLASCQINLLMCRHTRDDAILCTGLGIPVQLHIYTRRHNLTKKLKSHGNLVRFQRCNLLINQGTYFSSIYKQKALKAKYLSMIIKKMSYLCLCVLNP